ncbi:MAG: tRNA dihydrouridine synthase DusB [Patescibacteria group bacterium]|nr:tRNA dihydrouridine synthase DusB [Patescibacteria group bacterium]
MLAPMADMTDSAFGRLARRLGADAVFREMISAEALTRGNPATLAMAAFVPEERPIILQIFGTDSAMMAETVRILDERLDPDGFDINMGCPAQKIVGNFNGSALMREPAVAAAIVRAMKAATTKPVSVKTRLGWSRPEEILEFIRVLEDAGADLVTIHGRTKEQGYAGTADWEMIGRARQAVKIPVIANGDVIDGASARRCLEITGASGIMIGRGALGNPWVFGEIHAALADQPWTPPTTEEKNALILEHARLYAERWGGDEPLVTFRKHLIYYFRGTEGAKRWREQAVAVSTMEDLKNLLDTI